MTHSTARRLRLFATLSLAGATATAAFALSMPQTGTSPPATGPATAPPAAPAAAPAADLPAATTLLEKHLAAIGGKDAVAAVKSMRFKGSLDSAMAKMEVDVATMVPNMTRIIYTSQGKHWETACDGTIGWATDPMGGKPVLLEKEIVEGMKSGVDFQGLFRSPTNLFSNLTTTGSEAIGGAECWTVSMKSKAGENVTGFFSKATGLFTAIRQTQQTPRGPATMSMRVTEWQDATFAKSAIKVAKAIEIEESGLRSTGTFSGFEVNTLDAAYFVAPQEVKDLAAAAPASAPAAPASPKS